jgi:hypothetical protein
MPITAITSQPAGNSLNAAYRPIVFQVTATPTTGTGVPPVVYCDIYFGGIYYKSLSRTIPLSTGAWQFDIQDAAQEYLRKYLAPNGGANLYNAAPAMTRVYCRFRSSATDFNGFVQPESTAPVQGTGSNLPIAGTGVQSNTLYVVNSTLQHEDNQDLATHLNGNKSGTWNAVTFPLTHRPMRHRLHIGNSDYFPIAYVGDSPVKCIRLYYRYKGQTNYLTVTKCFDNPCPAIFPITAASPVDSTTQQLLFTWNAMPYYVTGMKIEYRKEGTTGDWSILITDANPTITITVNAPRGVYDIWFTAIGNCQGERTGYNNIGII